MRWRDRSRYHAESDEDYRICWDGRPEGEGRIYLAWTPQGEIIGRALDRRSAEAACEQHGREHGGAAAE